MRYTVNDRLVPISVRITQALGLASLIRALLHWRSVKHVPKFMHVNT